ncbi:MAG: carbohydrate binding family 9 domain-containing protein [Balneolaceae bacterium]|nr:carbohydrate binding family 9 domain-containing protein [Balneolaceae bacterium]
MKKVLLSMLLVCLCYGVNAQNSYQSTRNIISMNDLRYGDQPNPKMNAVRIDDGSIIDLNGGLDESVWALAPAATRFTQRTPNDGGKPSQKTKVKLLYTDEAVYVGIMAYDTAPDSIMSSLFRRDGSEASDWVYVSFDSYNDQRTAFTFAVNPRGVQKDVLYYDDTNEDILWDAVWQAKTKILENGWSAELRIPLSQLRFSSKNNEQSWGVNFQRRVARNGEVSFWAPTSQDDNGMVSLFGRLEGISNLEEPRRLEISPYVSSKIIRVPEFETSNPYVSRNEFTGNIGGDIKYGLTSDLTLTATINPDFGQVEADPAVINLSDNENFFAEKRPFFLEGNDIFQFGETKTFSKAGNPLTFYTRRIGRSPQGSSGRAEVNAEYTDAPGFTTIAAAAKVSGKTANGWSLGFMDAYTLKENADFTTPNGTEGAFAVEPATNYMIGRAKKDFNGGNTYFGGFASAVNRNIDGTYFEDYLRSSAYVGGVDFEHNFNNRNWVASGNVVFSSVYGSAEAIERTQRSPVRRYDRVDSDYLSVDPNKTSLSGYATELSIQKSGGEDHWMGSFTYSDVSPGYETNDLGFQNRANYRMMHGGVVYKETNPKWLQRYEVWLYTAQGWNYDGDRINNNISTGGFLSFKNLWTLNYNANYNMKQYMDSITRGGPIMERPEDINFNMNLNTNQNRKVSFHLGSFQRKDVEGEFDHNFWGGITILPTTFIQLSVSPQFSYQNDTDQYVTTVADDNANQTFGNRYVFADIKQRSLSANIRLNWTFSPTMSLQTYIRPFIASGDYSAFKEFKKAKTFNFNEYGTEQGTISKEEGEYTVDPDAEGTSPEFSFRDPDFNFRSVQGNAVFRWEYTPGSTLFLVWQQQRSDFYQGGDFQLGRDFNGLFSAKPTNIFLVKLSYWFGS